MSTRQYNWTDDYTRIPFKLHGRDETGLDCYGLIRLILAEQKGIVLPALLNGYESVKENEKISDLILTEADNAQTWLPVLKEQEMPFDVMVLNQAGLPCHVAVVIKKGKMIHIMQGGNVCCVDYRRGEWSSPKKIAGIFRHKDLCS